MTNDRETLPDLIETRSAQHTIPRRKLWRLAFAAILDGALNPDFGELTLDTAFDHGGTKLTWRRVIADGLAGLGRRAALRQSCAQRVFQLCLYWLGRGIHPGWGNDSRR